MFGGVRLCVALALALEEEDVASRQSYFTTSLRHPLISAGGWVQRCSRSERDNKKPRYLSTAAGGFAKRTQSSRLVGAHSGRHQHGQVGGPEGRSRIDVGALCPRGRGAHAGAVPAGVGVVDHSWRSR